MQTCRFAAITALLALVVGCTNSSSPSTIAPGSISGTAVAPSALPAGTIVYLFFDWLEAGTEVVVGPSAGPLEPHVTCQSIPGVPVFTTIAHVTQVGNGTTTRADRAFTQTIRPGTKLVATGNGYLCTDLISVMVVQ